MSPFVLSLCTENSALSILAEYLLRKIAHRHTSAAPRGIAHQA